MPGTLTARETLMANEPRNSRPIARGRLYANNDQDSRRESDYYNRSSLAIDPEIASPRPYAHSQVVEWPRHIAAVAPQGALWRGEDPFAYKRSRASNVLSFILHAVVIGLLLYLGVHFKVVVPAV